MTQGQDFTQIGVQAESGADGARDLTDLEGMGQSVSEVIRIVGVEDLSLLLQTAKRLGVNDAVPIPLEGVAIGVRRLRVAPSLAGFDSHGEGSEGRHDRDYSLREKPSSGRPLCGRPPRGDQ